MQQSFISKVNQAPGTESISLAFNYVTPVSVVVGLNPCHGNSVSFS